MWRHGVVVLTTGLLACAEDAQPVAPVAACDPPRRIVGERCLDPGVADDGCPAGTLGQDGGTCLPAGITAEGCAEGFVHDGDVGCMPILPARDCPPGLMAIVGEQSCRRVMACGSSRWGDIPIESGTVYVDPSYVVGDSDGSSARPWNTIAAAYLDAAPGAQIALAAGSYPENVFIDGKAVRLWGVCPEKVEIAGSGGPTITIGDADGTELHGFAVRGTGPAIILSGSQGVELDRLWVHTGGDRGIDAESTFGPTSVRVRDSLVELTHEYGMFLLGVDAEVEATVVRDTQPRISDQLRGRGIGIQRACNAAPCSAPPPTVRVSRSLLERNRDVAVHVAGSNVHIDKSVVRRTSADGSQLTGRAINAQPSCPNGTCDPATAANVELTGSFIDDNRDAGVSIIGSNATISATVIRGTQPQAGAQVLGRGLQVQACRTQGGCVQPVRAALTLSSSLIENNHDTGIVVSGSTATIAAVVVRDTLPQVTNGDHGRGIDIQLSCDSGACDPTLRSQAELLGSRIERNHDAGVVVAASDATIGGTLVIDTRPNAMHRALGIGLSIQRCIYNGCDDSAVSSAVVSGSAFEQSHYAGLVVFASTMHVIGTAVRDTVASEADGLFGDGMAVVGGAVTADVEVASTLVERSARAGLSNFGAVVRVADSAVQCAGFDLEGEIFDGRAFAFHDGGDNRCGCPMATGSCAAVSTGLSPPQSPAPLE
jgi:hypothetical protein